MPLTMNTQNHQELIDRIRKRKCFADKDLEEIASDQRDQQMNSRFFQKQVSTHNFSAFREPKCTTDFDNSTFLSHSNSNNSPNSIMQYYSMIFMYLLNNQSSTMGPVSSSAKINVAEDQYKDNSTNNKNLARVTNFSVDALLNVS